METRRHVAVGAGALFLLLEAAIQPGTIYAGGCGYPPTAFFTHCSAKTIALDCSAVPPQSWPAAEPIRIGVACTDVACPPPLSWCPWPESCYFSDHAPVALDAWDVQRRNLSMGGSFRMTDLTCPDHDAVLEYDRLLQPHDDYFLTYVPYLIFDYLQIAVTGTIPPPSPTATSTPTPSPTPTQRARPCVGDCNEDGVVRVDELITGTHIVLEREPLSRCPALDCTIGDAIPPVDCMIVAVGNALTSCQPPARD